MDILSSLLLGALQGITEFLPISSSGHLVLVQKLIPGFSQPGILFDSILHMGTLFSVLYFFRNSLKEINLKYAVLLIIGTIPAVIAGLFFSDGIEEMFKEGKFLGYEFLLTGILNFMVDWKPKIKSPLNLKNSFLIGIAQAIAIIPAISRSGATIFAGRRLGIGAVELARYSFLLSVPAIVGANVLQLYKHGVGSLQADPSVYIGGFVSAFILGFLSIGVFMKLLVTNKFRYFGIYCIVLGLLVLFLL